jgi:putative transposase
VCRKVRALIFRIAAENPTWGAQRVHGEVLKLGFHLSETTVSRWPENSRSRQMLADFHLEPS